MIKTNYPMFQTGPFRILKIEVSFLGFVSDFDIRISDLLLSCPFDFAGQAWREKARG